MLFASPHAQWTLERFHQNTVFVKTSFTNSGA
jgi:hypothetical protein